MTHQPSLGSWLEGDGVHFRVWAPNASTLTLVLDDREVTPEREERGYWSTVVPGTSAGTRYAYRIDGDTPFPDPASRFQPDGVHAASEVIDPSTYEWRDQAWDGVALERLVTYEMHVGTWTADGTFAAAAQQLETLVDLGVSAVQLMPVADFPGTRNWGYDGVALFAPARCYGRPDDLRALVDRAHALGLGVILDVVYNHFGPDGAYQGTYAREYYSDRHSSLWGAGINLDGPGSAEVRAYFIESALHWMHEYHIDGLRLDATSALQDDSPVHFLEEYARRLHDERRTERGPILIAEDHRNLARLLQPRNVGGYGFDGVLADDFHHEMRRLLAGDNEGYYQDYTGTAGAVAAALQRGWEFTGEHSAYWGEPRGTDPTGIPLPHFVHCLQNHDQIGNRAFGDRLIETVGLDSVRAASAVLLASAATPMLFMGQEWAASTPFQFFTDHHAELGAAVTAGRRNEFEQWSAFRDEAMRERIPDPQALETFEASRLRWDERDAEPHASMLRLHRTLLALRATEPALQWTEDANQDAFALDDDSLVLIRRSGDDVAILVAHLRGGETNLTVAATQLHADLETAEVLLSTEEPGFAEDAQDFEVDTTSTALRCRFVRPGAVFLRTRVAKPTS